MELKLSLTDNLLPRQAEWEEFMSKFQKSDPSASSSEKWVRMERIFKLH